MSRSALRIFRCGRLGVLLSIQLSACAYPGAPPPGSREAQERQDLVAACEHRADEAYDITHRGDIYAPESQVNTPFSANYQPGIADRGLADLHARDRMVSDCIRNTGAEGTRTPQLPSPPPAAHP